MAFRPFDEIKDNYVADVSGGTTIYHGFYVPSPTLATGALDTAASQFKIAKETRDASGNTLTLKWAVPVAAASNGSNRGYASYDQVWDDRATLNYY